MNPKNRNLLVRLASALVLLPVVLFLLYKGGYFTAVLISLAAAICATEYYMLALGKLEPFTVLGAAIAAALPLLPLLAPADPFGVAFGLVGAYFFAAWIWLLLKGRLNEAPARASHGVTGLLYGGVGLMALSALRSGAHGFEWVLCTVVITWMNDTSAYFAGRFLGRHKLYPEVSPNKTWEGFAGGMAGSVIGMFGVRALYFPGLTALDCVWVGVAGGVLGPLGDLCESMLKRAYQAKDSGRIIPGHGGLLDRIDALIFNAPMVYVYAHFFTGR